MVDNNRKMARTPELMKKQFHGLQTTRHWGSDTDITKLPALPLSPTERALTKQTFYNSRPPTPNPNRDRNFNLFASKSKSRALSPCSNQRLAVTLDLRPLVESSALSKQGLVEPVSPRLTVRSLPSSPDLHRANTRGKRTPVRRLNSDSEEYTRGGDDRILQWIQDVRDSQEDIFTESSDFDTAECLDSKMRPARALADSIDYDSPITNTSILPVIKEGDRL